MKSTLLNSTMAWSLVIFLLFPALTRAETAVQAWVQRCNGLGNGYDGASAMAVDGSGNVIVTGYATVSGVYADYATIKYSGAGAPLWTNYYHGQGNGNHNATAVAVDTNGNVFVTGASVGSGTGVDYATVAYSSAGVPLWTNRYSGPGNAADFAYGVAVDGSGNVLVTGYTSLGNIANYAIRND